MWKILNFSIVALVFVGFCAGNSVAEMTTPPSEPQTAKHGQPCNETVRCSRNLGLFCDEGKCWCSLGEGRATTGSSSPCLRLAGHPCKFPNSNLTIRCTDGALCGEDGFCNCGPAFYQEPNNRCKSKKAFGYRRDSEEECDTSKMMACVNSKCGCFSKTEMYLDGDSCRIMVGRNCQDLNVEEKWANTSRILHADFVQVDDPYTRDERQKEVWLQIVETFSTAECILGSTCNSTTRRCGFLRTNTSTGIIDSCPKDQYMNVAEGSCEILKEIGGNCTVPEECNIKNLLSCVDGKCTCDPDIGIEKKYSKERYDYYDYDLHRTTEEVSYCVGKVMH